jgi:hypothetical protein
MLETRYHFKTPKKNSEVNVQLDASFPMISHQMFHSNDVKNGHKPIKKKSSYNVTLMTDSSEKRHLNISFQDSNLPKIRPFKIKYKSAKKQRFKTSVIQEIGKGGLMQSISLEPATALKLSHDL